MNQIHRKKIFWQEDAPHPLANEAPCLSTPRHNDKSGTEHVSTPEKELETKRSSLLSAHRLTIYDLRVPTTTRNFAITLYRKS
jgi:hypothetical protein